LSGSSVVIVGPGALGTALAQALTRAGVPVAAVAGRNRERVEGLASVISGSRAVALSEAGGAGSVVLLTVADSAIEVACAAINAHAGTVVAHASGSRDVAPLEAARARGALVGSLHPLAAVARGAPAGVRHPESYRATFDGAAFAIEGSDEAAARLEPLALAVGGQPFRIVGADKPLYHLGASMLAAFSAGLAQVAWEQMRSAGADADLASAGVSHLLGTVAGNIGRAPYPAAAQTGPVARGDAAGVARQASVARALSAEAQAIYRVHCAHAVALALRAGSIDDGTATRLLAALDRAAEGPHDGSA
jgi:predicted short-subunit dehydrogenase-like oxidoreductase (DUF2520 family)